MKYLITGGAGFIGSNLAYHLLEKGEDVRILDNLSTGRLENISPILSNVEFINGDIRDSWTVNEAMIGVDYVLHQAALPSVPRSVENPLTSNEVNINGTLNVLYAARNEKVKKVVLAASSSAYGETEELPKHEKIPPSPLSPYAVTKLTCEYYFDVFYKLYGLPTVSLRYFNIFGPRQDPKSDYAAVIPKFISCLMRGVKPTVFGDGLQSRDFTFVQNAIEANILAATNEKMVGDVFNVACGAQYTLNDLLDKLREILGVDTEAIYAKERPGDIKHSFASIDKIKKFGYKGEVDFTEGLKRTVAFFKR